MKSKAAWLLLIAGRSPTLSPVAARFGQQYARILLRSSRHFRKEVFRVGELVHHRERESESHFSFEIADAHGFRRSHACIDTVQNVRVRGAPLQALDHFRLQVDSNHSSAGTDKARERDCEESYAEPGSRMVIPSRT